MTEVKYCAALEDGHAFDFMYEDNPKCPHCGEIAEISSQEWYQLYEEGEHEVECPFCDLQYTVSTHVKFTFSTDEQGDV